MDIFSVEVAAEKERLNLWIPEIGAGCRAQFPEEVKVTAQNLIYIVTGRPRKSYRLQISWGEDVLTSWPAIE